MMMGALQTGQVRMGMHVVSPSFPMDPRELQVHLYEILTPGGWECRLAPSRDRASGHRPEGLGIGIGIGISDIEMFEVDFKDASKVAG
jgi:hypothetical protein